MRRKKQHIDLVENRYGLFMTEESFNLDITYGQHYQKNDNVQHIILHRIDTLKSKTHNLYNQSKPKDKKFHPPIKLNVFISVNENKNEQYGGDGGVIRDDTGNLEFGIYLTELKENNCEINRGDIIEYNISGEKNRYYEVFDANINPDVSDRSFGGFKPYWRLIKAHPVKEDVHPFLNERYN